MNDYVTRYKEREAERNAICEVENRLHIMPVETVISLVIKRLGGEEADDLIQLIGELAEKIYTAEKQKKD